MQTRTTAAGTNRTGIKSSPSDSNELLAATSATIPPPGDDSAIGDVRLEYIAAAEALGSIPVSETAKQTAGQNAELLIDKLAERLAFERTGTRLYEALMIKHQAYDDEVSAVPFARIQEIHDEEARHFALLRASLELLGADPTTQTPCADITAVESMGLMQVLTDPRTTFAQCLHAILIAELTDVEGWDLLIALAHAHGQKDMAASFAEAREAEKTHLNDVRKWLRQLSLAQAPVSGNA